MVRKLLRAALIASVAITVSTPAGATQWGNYHWATTNGILAVSVNYSITPGVWGSSVGGAIADWDTPPSIYSIPDHLTLNPQISTADPRKCSPVSSQILVCNYSYGYRGWLGIANIWTSGNHILKATTRLNDSYFNMTAYNTLPWRSLVACQEIGHNFGLGHQDEVFGNVNKGTCMDYTNAPAGGTVGGFDYGPTNEHPNLHDTEELNIIYGHTDSYTTTSAATNFGVRQVGHAVPQALPDPGNTVAEWGTPVHRDGKGRADLFVRPLPNGGKMLTHVFWALDAKGNEAN